MIDLNKTTIQELRDAIALVESAKAAGISLDATPRATASGGRIMVRGVAICKGNLKPSPNNATIEWD